MIVAADIVGSPMLCRLNIMSLDQTTAQFRASVVRQGSISYNFNIILKPDGYHGLAELTFYLEHTNFDHLPLDFTSPDIHETTLNLKTLTLNTTANYLLLPKTHLQKGRNKLSVRYTNKFDIDRRGCMTFEVDGQQYIYTKFEPYGAHKVFPCFDQPDLKARMKIAVVAPNGWTSLSNQPASVAQQFNAKVFGAHSDLLHATSAPIMETFLAQAASNTHMTLFDYTEPLSTYLYVFASGPYGRIDAPAGVGTVPMSLYCAHSSYAMMDAYSTFIFDVVSQAMTFFEIFFNKKYPFSKYDQIFVRDFQSSAMENAGLVAFREERFLISYSTEDDYFNFANTMVHELSHHWFGNLVTMKWWDDLWLNESFADFIASFALDRINSSLIHPLQPSGMYFRDRKSWGYDEDERNNATHPIRAQVQDTDVAVSIFDGITYAKGAATLKQLMLLVGETGFSKGLQSYIDRFKWSNATISDLLQDLAPYFPAEVTIENWMHTWLESSSLNVFETVWDPKDLSTTATLSLRQYLFSPDYTTLRWHKLQVAFYNANADVIKIETVLVPPSDTPFEITYDGSQKVKAILVNYNDQSFIENYLDPVSLDFFLKNIEKIDEDLPRSLIWFNLAQLNKQGLMRVDDYVAFLSQKLFDEPQTFVVNQLLTGLLAFISGYLSADEGAAQSTIIFEAIYQRLKDETLTDTDRLQVLYKNYVKYALTDQQVLKLKDWILGDDPALAGRTINDNNLPWEIVKKVFSVSDSALSKEQKDAVFNAVKAKDNTARAVAARQVCDIILCSKEDFDAIF
jgi:aminopeptidase N